MSETKVTDDMSNPHACLCDNCRAPTSARTAVPALISALIEARAQHRKDVVRIEALETALRETQANVGVRRDVSGMLGEQPVHAMVKGTKPACRYVGPIISSLATPYSCPGCEKRRIDALEGDHGA